MDKRIYRTTYNHQGDLLVKSKYKNCTYYIVTFGTHPCAYIDVSDFNLSEEDVEEIKCHGGVTYFENSFLYEPRKTGYDAYIGWDYAHCEDYVGFYTEKDVIPFKTWTVEEIAEECRQVIYKLNYGSTPSTIIEVLGWTLKDSDEKVLYDSDIDGNTIITALK